MAARVLVVAPSFRAYQLYLQQRQWTYPDAVYAGSGIVRWRFRHLPVVVLSAVRRIKVTHVTPGLHPEPS